MSELSQWKPDDFIAGRVALDFGNTMENWLDPAKHRRLIETPEQLYDWLVYAGTLERVEAKWCFEVDQVRGRGDRGRPARATYPESATESKPPMGFGHRQG